MTELKTDEFHKLFDLELGKDFKDMDGKPIQVEVLEDRKDATKNMVPVKDSGYVFDGEKTATICMGLDARLNTPVLLWGYHGSGKSTLAEQICNRLNRPALRVQHSVDTESSDIVGQWVLEGDRTVFHLGPLARAMRDGLVYIADEYDFALPNVLAVYQAVLEGAPLFIKQAPEDMALIKPHKDFRFIATGNTNGSGDETGLYQGTQIQNAANYSRFGITVKIDYQKPETEKTIISNKIGALPADDLDKIFQFVGKVREAYDNRSITNTLSTREVLMIVTQACFKGRERPNFMYGIEHAFLNRMSSIDSGAIKKIAERIFS